MNIFKHSVNLSLVLFFLVLCAPVPQQNADQSEGSSSEKEEELAFNLDINNLIQSNPNAECDDVTGSTITEWVKRAKHWDVCYNNSSIKFDKWDYLFGGYNKGETTLTVHGEYNKDEDTNAKLTVTVKKNESWVDDQPCSSSKRDKQKACLKFECVENNKIQISCVEPKKSGDIELLNAAKKWVKGDKDRTETVENEKVNIWGDLFQSNPVNFWYGMCPFNLVPAAYLDSANKVKGECNTEGGCLKVFKRVYQVDFDEYSDNSEVEKWPSDTIGYKGEFLEFKDAEMTDRCVDDNQCYNDQVKLFEDERNITCRPPRLYSDLSSYKKISNYSENIEINDPKKIFKTKTHVIINTGQDIKYVGNLALISDRIKDANDLYISDRNISRFTDNEVESVNVTIDDELMEKTNSNFCQGKPLHYSFDHFTDDIYEKMYGNEISGKIGGAILYKIINILNYSLNAWGNKEMNTSDQSLKEILIKDPNKKIRKLDRFDVNKEIGNEGRLMQFFEKTINNNFYPKDPNFVLEDTLEEEVNGESDGDKSDLQFSKIVEIVKQNMKPRYSYLSILADYLNKEEIQGCRKDRKKEKVTEDWLQFKIAGSIRNDSHVLGISLDDLIELEIPDLYSTFVDTDESLEPGQNYINNCKCCMPAVIRMIEEKLGHKFTDNGLDLHSCDRAYLKCKNYMTSKDLSPAYFISNLHLEDTEDDIKEDLQEGLWTAPDEPLLTHDPTIYKLVDGKSESFSDSQDKVAGSSEIYQMVYLKYSEDDNGQKNLLCGSGKTGNDDNSDNSDDDCKTVQECKNLSFKSIHSSESGNSDFNRWESFIGETNATVSSNVIQCLTNKNISKQYTDRNDFEYLLSLHSDASDLFKPGDGKTLGEYLCQSHGCKFKEKKCLNESDKSLSCQDKTKKWRRSGYRLKVNCK